jgi:hypothetical protein
MHPESILKYKSIGSSRSIIGQSLKEDRAKTNPASRSIDKLILPEFSSLVLGRVWVCITTKCQEIVHARSKVLEA